MPTRARGLKMPLFGEAELLVYPHERTCPKTASPPPCTCVGEPAKASTAKKLASVIKDTNHHRFLPKRDEAVADARHHGVTIQRLGGTLYDDSSALERRLLQSGSSERMPCS